MSEGIKARRRGIGKKLRFEVFKRDGFACQYCGKAAPDVILHVDHIEPVAKGGGNDLLNLITSCADCNGGKGATRLDDNATLLKQRQQLAELSERREQLRMMVEWRKGLKEVDELALEAVNEHFEATFEGWCIRSDDAFAHVRKLIRSFGVAEVMEAIDIARDRYAPTISEASVKLAFSKIGGICNNRSKPDEGALFYARGIIRNRFSYLNEQQAMVILRAARKAGADDDEIKDIARTCTYWSQWCDAMDALIRRCEG